MFRLSPTKLKEFQYTILDWYANNQRDLPWRNTRDPYNILVSEMMLQQTQVNRVIPKFEVWLRRFPDIKALADAPFSEVLAFWSGLGYNRRALYLKKTAQIIVEKYNGKFPEDEKLLRSLPGIGEYTARAILCFAFNKQIAVVDTNIRKVILTQFTIEVRSKHQELRKKIHDSCFLIPDSGEHKLLTKKEIEETAQSLLPPRRAYEWNQALMDYSREMLREHKIPIPKQSKFHGSQRYYRGQILRVLLQEKKVSMKDLGALIKKDYTKNDDTWLRKLVKDLAEEGFIIYMKGYVSLVS